MTPFEIIIISIVYLFCYGYILAIFIKEENIWLRILLVFVSFILALYAPLIIGGMLYDKLNEKGIDDILAWLEKQKEIK